MSFQRENEVKYFALADTMFSLCIAYRTKTIPAKSEEMIKRDL